MAQVHLEQVLTATGLPADQVKALVELPADAPDFKADPFVAPIRTNVETAVKNDPKFYEGLNKENLPKDFLKTIESEQYGRAANIVRTTMLKAVGLKEDDFKELGEDAKKIEVFTPAFTKKLTEGKVTDKELQQKLIEANNQIETLTTQGTELEKKYADKYTQELASYQFQAGVLAQLAQVAGLKAPAKYLVDTVATALKSKFGYEIVNGVPELRQKDKPALKVLTANGTKELTLQDAIGEILKADDLVDPKKTTKQETTTTVVTTTGDGLKVTKGVSDKMARRIAEEKKAAGEA
jgi:hypothetical protein